MTDGSAVRLNGILVGKVSRIELTGDANNKRAVRMTMEIEEHFKGNIPKDSEVGYDAENVLGTKYLNIERGQSREHVQTGAEIKSKDEMDVMAMLQSASPLLESMQSILKRVDGLVAQLEAGKGSIGRLLYDDEMYRKVIRDSGGFPEGHARARERPRHAGRHALRPIVVQRGAGYGETAGQRDRGHPEGRRHGGQTGQGSGAVRRTEADLDGVEDAFGEPERGPGKRGQTAARGHAAQRVIATLNRLNGTLDKLNAGQGTLGQLMVNPALYENLTAPWRGDAR